MLCIHILFNKDNCHYQEEVIYDASCFAVNFVIAVICLLFACGSETGDTTPEALSMASKSLSLSKAELCSDGPSIAAGVYHTAGLKSNGTIIALGDNTYGQLNIHGRALERFQQAHIIRSDFKSDGSVVAAGHNGYDQLKVSAWKNIKAITAGWYHTIGLQEDGTVVAAGDNSYKQLNVSTWTNIQRHRSRLATYHRIERGRNGCGSRVMARMAS